MTKEEKEIGIMAVVLFCLLTVFVGWAVTTIGTSVREKGLRSIWEDVWCGEKGCDYDKK